MSMDDIKKNCDGWVDYAYNNWLLGFRRMRPDEFYLRKSTRILVGRMRDASRSNEEVWNLLERLKKLGSGIHNMQDDFGGNKFLYEQAEINLECAVVAYRMGDNQEASMLLDMTVGSFHGRSIHKAVSCWIYGCIQWQSQSHFDLALINWEKSHHIIAELVSSPSFDQSFAHECKTIEKEMDYAILRASDLGCSPPPPKSATPPIRNASVPKVQPARLQMFSILGTIPAGSPVGIVDNSDEKTSVDGFEINGQFYTAYNLKEGTLINVNQNHRYYLLRVSGESMNNAFPVNIEDSDYVLMVKQDSAESGDIIAAEIETEDREATLKRYYQKDGKYILEPQSRNPALKDHLTFSKDFYIRGKAIAVLKRNDT